MTEMITYRMPQSDYSIKVLHAGERKDCPACGERNSYGWYPTSENGITRGVVCRSNWFTRMFGACSKKENHLHQHCMACRAKWIVAWIDDTNRSE